MKNVLFDCRLLISRAGVGKVEAIDVEGLDLWFWSDDHGPPHFHAKRAGEWEIAVFFLEVTERSLVYEVKWGRGPAGRLAARIAGLVVAHREAPLQEWEEKSRMDGC